MLPLWLLQSLVCRLGLLLLPPLSAGVTEHVV
jgi:hypothetical protein